MIDDVDAPPGWIIAKLGEITECVDKIDPKKEPDREIRYVDISSIDNKRNEIKEPSPIRLSEAPSRARQIIKKGDVLFSLVRPYLRNIAWVDGSLDQEVASTGFCVLRANELIDPKFIFYKVISQKFINDISENQYGVSYPAVNEKQIRSQLVEVPPASEQRRIVKKIESLFAQLDKGEESLRQVQTLLARYRQSVLKAAVTGELTADWRAQHAGQLEHGRDLLERILKARRENWQGRGKYKEPVEPDTSDLPELPEGWVWASLPMLGEFGRGKSKHRPRNDPKLYDDGTYPFLQTGRIRNSGGRIVDCDKYYNELGLAQSKLWPKGTVCITIAANIAESGVLDIDACFPDSVVGLVPHKNIRSQYVECFIRTAKRELDRYAPATAQKNINLEILSNVAIPLPSTAEQDEILKRLNSTLRAIEVVESFCQAELTRSSALRQSILKDAFSGKLVPQDPNDEPAAELLARIQASRAPAKKAPRRSRKAPEPA